MTLSTHLSKLTLLRVLLNGVADFVRGDFKLFSVSVKEMSPLGTVSTTGHGEVTPILSTQLRTS